MNRHLKNYIAARSSEERMISDDRRIQLMHFVEYLNSKIQHGKEVSIIFICTHNSRRSFFAQALFAAACAERNVRHVKAFSGGTEATSLHPNTMASLERAGFEFEKLMDGENPIYACQIGEQVLRFFSKTFDATENPQTSFAAVMVCSEAETNCPYVAACEKRMLVPYADPKSADELPSCDQQYDERRDQIAREMMYVVNQL